MAPGIARLVWIVCVALLLAWGTKTVLDGLVTGLARQERQIEMMRQGR